MYKIYINESPLILISSDQLDANIYARENVIIAPYMGKKKMLLQYIDNLEKSDRFDAIILHTKNIEQLYSDFKELFKIIRAAGGLVTNKKGEILFIFRRGFWDLPKGKLDNGENYKEAAIREVKEECGLVNLELKDKLITTFHVFQTRGGSRVLKKSKWYHMTSTDKVLTPQKEEDIEEAKWRKLGEFLASDDECYKNIYDVLFTFYKNI